MNAIARSKQRGLLPLMMLAGCMLASCGGGEGGGNDTTPQPPPRDTTPPAASSTSPANADAGTSPDSVVTVTFSEAMDAATINAGTFTVADVRGAVTYDAASHVATFTPSSGLPEATTLTVAITTGVKDLAGNPLASARTWSFTTRERVWAAAMPIPGSDDTAHDPHIASDTHGNIFAIWIQNDSTRSQVRVNHHTADAGWETAVQLMEDGDGKYSDRPRVAMDHSGNAVAMWSQHSRFEISPGFLLPDTGQVQAGAHRNCWTPLRP